MPLTLALAQGAPIGTSATATGPLMAVVNQTTNFMVTVTNTGTAAVTLLSLFVAEATESDALVSQPNIAQPNLPASQALPVLGPSVSATYVFQAVFNSPNGPGVSPNNPGGAAPGQDAMEADAIFSLAAMAQSSDGSTATTSSFVTLLTSTSPTPQPTGGAAQFSIGFDSNLIAVIL